MHKISCQIAYIRRGRALNNWGQKTPIAIPIPVRRSHILDKLTLRLCQMIFFIILIPNSF